MTLERRTFVRFRLDVPASLFLYQFDVEHVGSVVDLSMGGCFFPVTGDLPIGEKCQIKLTSGEGLVVDKIDFNGIIVRKSTKGVGIQFQNILPEHEVALHRILSKEAEPKNLE